MKLPFGGGGVLTLPPPTVDLSLKGVWGAIKVPCGLSRMNISWAEILSIERIKPKEQNSDKFILKKFKAELNNP